MSQMPAKKKSCFQITSVIQAQVAGNNITDDPESNDEPDELHAEEGSSETLDVSRTDVGVCDRSSSEDALDHTGDVHNGPVLMNGHLPVKSIGTGGRNTPVNLGGSAPAPAASQPIVSTPTSQPSSVSSSGAPTSCSSRFRVIKLDLGNGEPFKRGRWACTEFYEKDSESNRTVDSMKPITTYDHSNGRDSGLGISNSTATPRAFSIQPVELTDGGHPKGHPAPLPSSEPLQQPNAFAPRIGSVTSAFQPTGYATTKTQKEYGDVQPVVSQTHIPNSLNGVHPGATLQTSPPMPSATPPQQPAYSNGLAPAQPLPTGSSTQSFPAASQSTVPQSSQPPVSTSAGPGAQGSQAQGAEGALAPGLRPRTVSTRAVSPVTQTLGRMGITSSPVPIASYSDVQSVSATVPSISAAPGHSSAAGGQTLDPRPQSDALPLSISSVVPGKAAIKITDGLSLTTPTVSLFGIPIPVNVDDDR